MKKNINRIINILTIILLIIGTTITILSFNRNELGVISIFNHTLIESNSDINDLNIKKGSLLVFKNSDIIKEKSTVLYLNNEKKVTYNIGKVTDIIVNNKDNTYLISDRRINKSDIIGTYKFKIPTLGSITNYLLTRDGFLLAIAAPLLVIAIYKLFYFIENIHK